MCGICGIVEAGEERGRLLTQMCGILAHRGPDASSQHRSGAAWLGHRRLSIIDLRTGDQPIFNEDRTLCIVYNGEIYNYRELRAELKSRGAAFRTESDTEVILKLYEMDGPHAFARLNGIFAFAVLDERTPVQRVVLVRDHFGIKPLHYYVKDGLLVFASEQKAILLHPKVERELNPQALHAHLNLRYTHRPDGETLFRSIRRLPPAHFLVFEEGRVKELTPYFRLEYRIDVQKDESHWLEEIRAAIRTAVKRQLVSDVPIGVYLSGGMDSSSIVALMHDLGVEEINTFTLGFNEPSDELPDAEVVAQRFGTRHRTLNMSLNPMRLMPEVIWHAEEPKINLLQGFLMSKFVSDHVKVVLGGLGGDELFSGYDIHQYIYPFNKLHRWIPGAVEERMLAPLSELGYRIQQRIGSHASDEYRRGVQMALATGNPEKFYLILRNVWDYDRAHWERIYSRDFLSGHELEPVGCAFRNYFPGNGTLSALEHVYHAEFETKMVNDYLLTEDRMAMAHSVEERVPFLDLDLVRLGFSIPAQRKMRLHQTKYLLRKAMQPYLPDQIVRKKKWGFTFNPYLQYQKDLKETAQRILTRERIEADGIFNYDYIRSIFDAPPHPRMRWHYNFIWIVTGFYIWKQMFIDSDAFAARNVDLEAFFG